MTEKSKSIILRAMNYAKGDDLERAEFRHGIDPDYLAGLRERRAEWENAMKELLILIEARR